MAKKTISKELMQKIDEYVDVLRKDKLPIKKVIIFGSYAKGTSHKWSDIDLCIVSPKFLDSFSAMQYLMKKTIFNMKYTIEPIGFNLKDFSEGSSLIDEIKKTGIEIKI
ncbi:MAG: nucleotidyltransferase domain-containing protein [Candidatus Falkowbacteria bacterium]|nr:nucleotidyltransferase domain-containing protein [Candidatus Falkowbacteria bacterium]